MSTITLKVYLIKTDFDSNNFTFCLKKLSNTAITQIVSAQNDMIYSLLIKITDTDTKNPISNISILVSGNSYDQKKKYNENAVSDNLGTAKFSLNKGEFRISFSMTDSQDKYALPSSYFLDLKSPGTTILSFSLKSKTLKQGIVEIEVLDERNKPITNIELATTKPFEIKSEKNKIFNSYTNSDGIAIFKLYEGTYNIEFIRNSISKSYNLPSSFDIVANPDAITHYFFKINPIK